MGMEEVIGSHPNISAALLVGQGRRRSSLLIRQKKSLMSPEEREGFLEDLWPTVERANKLCFAHGRVLRGLVLFTSAEKPMLRAGKGQLSEGGQPSYTSRSSTLSTTMNSKCTRHDDTEVRKRTQKLC